MARDSVQVGKYMKTAMLYYIRMLSKHYEFTHYSRLAAVNEENRQGIHD